MTNTEAKLIGQILLDQRAITQEQLKDALMRKQTRASKKRLGDVMVSYGYITPEHLTRALATQFNLEFVNLEALDISKDLISLLDISIAKIHKVVPVRKEGATLFVAMSDPMNLRVTDDLRILLECDIQLVLATPRSIKDALAKYYGVEDMTIETELSNMSRDSVL